MSPLSDAELASLDPSSAEGLVHTAGLGRRWLAHPAAPQRAPLVEALLAGIKNGVGDARERLEAGEVLGLLGDPRLRRPTDPNYWVAIEGDANLSIGRYPVTNDEYAAWVAAGGYEQLEHWSPEGRAWLSATADPWPVRARGDGSRPFVVPNQPVVGVTVFEAEAYATAHGARLPRSDERVWTVRGAPRRPYPWGSPFGEGSANTREEVLGRPCAVGLYTRDATPEGVFDLAGNVAEWTADGVGTRRLIHPGAWDQPSMASWAKAAVLERPEARWPGLGFRLARD